MAFHPTFTWVFFLWSDGAQPLPKKEKKKKHHRRPSSQVQLEDAGESEEESTGGGKRRVLHSCSFSPRMPTGSSWVPDDEADDDSSNWKVGAGKSACRS
jgi:hypothetical protein